MENRKFVHIDEVVQNEDNPRSISEEKLQQLKKSIEDFPEMLQKRPLVCITNDDGTYTTLGGNMRLEALSRLNVDDFPILNELPILLADDWNEKQREQFVIKDNVSFGEWDWEILKTDWDVDQLNDWGIDDAIIEDEGDEIDYGALDYGSEDGSEKDIDKDLKDKSNNLKKAIMIEFLPEDYKEGYELINYHRKINGDIGKLIIELLRKL